MNKEDEIVIQIHDSNIFPEGDVDVCPIHHTNLFSACPLCLKEYLEQTKQKIIEVIKKWKYNKNGSFDRKTKLDYKRVNFKLFQQELLKSIEEI